jgi:hypothetical protein
MKAQELSHEGIHLFKTKNVCASTTRAINLIKDMFTPPDKVVKDSPSVTTINFGSIADSKALMQVSAAMPAHIYFGDITSDGFPDLMVTLQLKSGKSHAYALLNNPCSQETCSIKQTQAKRRTFIYKQHSL